MTSKPSILIVFAHPRRHQSRIHQTLLRAIHTLEGVTVVDLYEEYPDFLIDVKREQARLESHSLLILQHPIYWYSCPPLMKEWMDAVLERGWAYGEGAEALKGLDFFQVLSSGGPDSAYLRSGYNRFTIHELFRPFEVTAAICSWNYHQPFLVQGVNAVSNDELATYAKAYRLMLSDYLQNGSAVLNRLDTAVLD